MSLRDVQSEHRVVRESDAQTTDVVWAFDQHPSRTPPLLRVPGIFMWVDSLGQAQDLGEGLHVLTGMGRPWGPPRGAGMYCLFCIFSLGFYFDGLNRKRSILLWRT